MSSSNLMLSTNPDNCTYADEVCLTCEGKDQIDSESSVLVSFVLIACQALGSCVECLRSARRVRCNTMHAVSYLDSGCATARSQQPDSRRAI